MKVDMTNHFEGTVTWNDGTQEKVIHFENPMGNLYEFETASGHYCYEAMYKRIRYRQYWSDEHSCWVWGTAKKNVKEIKITTTMILN